MTDLATRARADLLAELEGELGVLIRRVKRVIGVRAEIVHPDLAPAAYLLLGFLAAEGPVRASVLVDRLGVDKGAISRQVQHLEELGLVERAPDAADGRASLVGATPLARERLEMVTTQRRGWLDERLGDWTEDDLGGFVDALARYNRALE
ncbi:MAG: MarR family transcriptional regulator [Nocardioidaceae bacterium]